METLERWKFRQFPGFSSNSFHRLPLNPIFFYYKIEALELVEQSFPVIAYSEVLVAQYLRPEGRDLDQ